jgi:hypothetical protein
MRLLNTAVALIVALAAWAVIANADTGRDKKPTHLNAPPSATFAQLVVPKFDGKPRAFTSAYVHRENCVAALLGANGDNDIAAFMSWHSQPGYVIESGTSRFSATRVAIPITFTGGPSATWPNGIGTFGYCMGDDPSIVDKVHQPPAGW